MDPISLKSIKWESIKSIFQVVAARETVSRAEISKETGLSLMTVGKVADALLAMDVITQEKERKNSAGRRAGLLSIQTDNFAMILDLTSRNFIMTVINMRLQIVEKHFYTYKEDYYYSENLTFFLKEIRLLLQTTYDSTRCIGVGVSVPGVYDPESDRVLSARVAELSELPIGEFVRNALEVPNIHIEASYHAAARSQISRVEDYKDKLILYWFINENNIYGTIVNCGRIVQGAHHKAGDFGNMVVAPKQTLEDTIRSTKTPEENAFELAKAIRNVMRVIDPDLIILECELYKSSKESQEHFMELVRKILTEDFNLPGDTLPQLLGGSCKFRHSHRGLTMQLRENWLSDIVLNGGSN